MSRMRRKLRLLLAGPGPGQARFFSCRGLEVQNPYAAAGRVKGAAVALDHRAPGFEGAHDERVSLEIVAYVVENFVSVPVVGEDGVTGVRARHGDVAVERRFAADFPC